MFDSSALRRRAGDFLGGCVPCTETFSPPFLSVSYILTHYTHSLLQPDRFISEHALDVSASTSYSIVSPSGMYSFLLDA